MKISIEKRPYIRESMSSALVAISTMAIIFLILDSNLENINNSLEHKEFEKNNDKKYEITYGNVNVNGSNFEYYDIKDLKIFKTTDGIYRIVIKDTNKNYYFIDEEVWYQIFIKDNYKYSLINENNQVVSGMFDDINYYLEGKNSWTIEELLNEQNNLNGMKLTKNITIPSNN